jgi:hypothetical protein
MSLDALLQPGERVLWRGRPRGFLPGLKIPGCVAAAITAGPLGCYFWGAFLVAWDEQRKYESFHPAAPVQQFELPFPVLFNYGPLAATIPLIVCPLLVVLLLVHVLVAARIERAITDRRAIFAAPWLVRSLPRAEIWRARVVGRALEIEATNGRSLRFRGIDDPEAALSALELG